MADRSVEGIADCLSAARSIAVTDGGTSGAQFALLLQKLRLDAQVQSKVELLPGGGPMAALLAGEVDLAVLPLTNVAPVTGVTGKAICPHELDVHVDLGFCLHQDANKATRAFADWLLDPKQVDTLARLGVERI